MTDKTTIEDILDSALVPNTEYPYPIPKNWRWVYVHAVSQIHRGVTYKKNNVQVSNTSNNCLVLRGGNIRDGYLSLDEKDNVYVDFSLIKFNQILKKNDVIIVSSTGSSVVIGRAGIVDKDYNDVSFGAFLTLIRHKKEISSKFFALYFQTDLYRNTIRSLAQGININNIRQDNINTLSLPLPPLAEQERIVNVIESLFDKLDIAKTIIENTLDRLDDRKSSILHRAFSGQLTAKWRAENGVDLDSWVDTTLGEVCEINPPKIKSTDINDELDVSFVPMVSVSDILGIITDNKTEKLHKVKNGYVNFIEGDILFAKITPCMENGKSAIVGELVNKIGYGSTEFYVLRCSTKVLNKYIHYILRNKVFRQQAREVMAGSVGHLRVPKQYMENYKIKLPSLSEQKEIVQILDELLLNESKTKTILEQKLSEINLLKKTILAKAFRGELGTNDPNEEDCEELLKTIIEADLNKPKVKREREKVVVIPEEIKNQLKSKLEKDIYHHLLKYGKSNYADLLNLNKDSLKVLQMIEILIAREILTKDNESIGIKETNNENQKTMD